MARSAGNPVPAEPDVGSRAGTIGGGDAAADEEGTIIATTRLSQIKIEDEDNAAGSSETSRTSHTPKSPQP